MVTRIILPLDGSALAEQAIDYAVTFAACTGARVALVRAVAGPDQAVRDLAAVQTQPGVDVMLDPRTVDAIAESAREAESEALSYLDQHAAALRARGITVDTRVESGKASEVILHEAAREPDTLVVMATQTRGGLSRLVFGSTAMEVLQHGHAPVLLVRVADGATTVDGGDIAGDISIGAEVAGTQGKLGTVHRLIADAATGQVTSMVVKHGFVFTGERIVPISRVNRVERGIVMVDLDEAGFEAAERFVADRYRVVEAHPEGVWRRYEHGYLLVALPEPATPQAGPGEDAITDIQQPVIAAGADVLDANGEKVGEVGRLAVEPETGRPSHLTLRQGRIFKQEMDLPIDWVEELSDKGVVLNVTREQVEALKI